MTVIDFSPVISSSAGEPLVLRPYDELGGYRAGLRAGHPTAARVRRCPSRRLALRAALLAGLLIPALAFGSASVDMTGSIDSRRVDRVNAIDAMQRSVDRQNTLDATAAARIATDSACPGAQRRQLGAC
jgi:hypothetical protein